MRATVASDQRRLAAAIALTRASSDRSPGTSAEIRCWSSGGGRPWASPITSAHRSRSERLARSELPFDA